MVSLPADAHTQVLMRAVEIFCANHRADKVIDFWEFSAPVG
jgi:hypothetical protein